MFCRPSRSIAGVRSGGSSAEVEADRRLHVLRLAARLHVQLDDEIGARLEPPGESPWAAAAAPAPASTRGNARRDRSPSARSARVAGSGSASSSRRDASVAIDADVRVMHDARVARVEFDAADVSSTRPPAGECTKMRKHIRAIRLQRVAGRRDDQVGRAQLPSCCPSRRCRDVASGRLRWHRPHSSAEGSRSSADVRRLGR